MKYVISIISQKNKYYLLDYEGWGDPHDDIEWSYSWKKNIKDSKYLELKEIKKFIKIIKNNYCGEEKSSLKIELFI